MKQSIFFVLSCVFSYIAYAQVGIGTTNPQAQLDIRSTNQVIPSNTDGILIPKVDTFPTGVNASQDAMLVYLTTTVGSDGPGFYYYNHVTTSWLSVGEGAKKIDDLSDAKSDNDGTDNGSSIFFGYRAGLLDDGTNNHNIGIGEYALESVGPGENNIAIGYSSHYWNSGSNNISLGSFSLEAIAGTGNIGIGFFAGWNSQNADFNVALGHEALDANLGGDYNLALGAYAGSNRELGDRNVFIGAHAGSNLSGLPSDKLYIENTNSNEPLIYGDFNTDELIFNGNVTISNDNGTHTNATLTIDNLQIADLGSFNLGLDGDIIPYGGNALGFDLGNNTATQHWDDVVADDFINFSDRRLKNSIKDIPYGLETVLNLNPVTYRYNKDFSIDDRFRLGLIAQEVEALIPEVVFNEDIDANPETGEKLIIKSDYKSMSYVELVPVLIKAIQEQQVEIETLKLELKTSENLEARIKVLEQKN